MPPVNTSPPTVSGTVRVGQTITADPGVWTESPLGYLYQWQTADFSGGTWTDLTGATASTYLLTIAELGKLVRVRVAAQYYSGSAFGMGAYGLGAYGTSGYAYGQGNYGQFNYGGVVAANAATAYVSSFEYGPILAAAVTVPALPLDPEPPLPAPWVFVIRDLNGRPLGRPLAFERTWSTGVSKPSTSGFRIRSDDPLWPVVAAGETMLSVYNSVQEQVLYGPIVTDEESAQGAGATVRCSAVDLSWRLTKRGIGKDPTGVGLKYTSTDSGQIMETILGLVNADEATGILMGTRETFVPRTVTYVWKKAMDALSELGAIDGSYEWQLRYAADGEPPDVRLDLLARLGTDKTSSVFLEYGTGRKNCRAYKRIRSIELLASHIWLIGSNNTIVSSASDPAAASAYRRHEEFVTMGDITVASLLSALAAAHVAIRRYPRSLVDLTPFPKTAPRHGADWRIGDTVSGRVQLDGPNQTKVTRVNGAVRIWAADITLSEAGEEQPVFHLAPEA